MSGDRKRCYRIGLIGCQDVGKTTIATQILDYNDTIDEYPELFYYLKGCTDAKRCRLDARGYQDDATYREELDLRLHRHLDYVPMCHETSKTQFFIMDTQDPLDPLPGGVSVIRMVLQAEIGILVYSDDKMNVLDEDGQWIDRWKTCEHIHLARAFGVSKLVVAVNYMTHPRLGWNQERYDAVVAQLGIICVNAGYEVEDVTFIPVCGLYDMNVHTKVDRRVSKWWDGPTLLDAVDAFEIEQHQPSDPLRIIVTGQIIIEEKEFLIAKVESGSVHIGNMLLLMPDEVQVEVSSLLSDKNKILDSAGPGECVLVHLLGFAVGNQRKGLVLSSIEKPIQKGTEFIARLLTIKSPRNAGVFSVGFCSILLLHTAVEDCEVMELIDRINPRTGKPYPRKPSFVNFEQGNVVVCRLRVHRTICAENYSDFKKLGGFALSSKEKIVATGKVVRFPA
ncbi:unnamed protein product [Lactuca virosa]|uniref:GTP-eEF1A C-terminal domain-containing protein n=1 Tax=Lactuca virosa TaxID=75947 RepID=A0AAU9NTT5_9ASTR|nr:unnamed protein product [Lactuca virosa]